MEFLIFVFVEKILFFVGFCLEANFFENIFWNPFVFDGKNSFMWAEYFILGYNIINFWCF